MSGEQGIELSEEMLEAIRIIKSDNQTLSFAQMTQSHKELISRLDKDAEERKNVPVPVPEKEIPKDEGTGGSGAGTMVVGGPNPPPKNEPVVEPVVGSKKQWWENYPQG